MMNPEQAKRKAMMPVKIGMIFWIIGLILILIAFYIEIFGVGPGAVPDDVSSKLLMTLKLGGIGLTLSGIFLSLVTIAKILGMMPMRLAMIMKQK